MFYDVYLLLCKRSGESPSKVAENIGLNRSAVVKWKKGSIPNGPTIQKLADYFRIPTDYLLGTSIEAQIDIAKDKLQHLQAVLDFSEPKEQEEVEHQIAILEKQYSDLCATRDGEQKKAALTEKDRRDITNLIPLPKTYRVPLVGTIACGQPILAVEEADETVEVPEFIKADFALRCKGDSMINSRIFDGDIVYIRSQPKVENGQIAAVRIGDEATLKKVYYNGQRLILRAANPLYADLEYEGEALSEIEILGEAEAFTSMLVT